MGSAETAGGEMVVPTVGSEKPREPDKTAKIKAKAHTVLTKFASEKGTDRKSVASAAILAYCAEGGVNADLPQLKSKSIHFLIDTLDMLDKAPEKVHPERVAIFKILIHEYPRLEAIPEKSSRGEPALPIELKEELYPDPDLLKEWHEWRDSLSAGDQASK